jgi:hypothetical protein
LSVVPKLPTLLSPGSGPAIFRILEKTGVNTLLAVAVFQPRQPIL